MTEALMRRWRFNELGIVYNVKYHTEQLSQMRLPIIYDTPLIPLVSTCLLYTSPSPRD